MANRAAAANPAIAPVSVITLPCRDADEFVRPGPPCRKATELAGSAALVVPKWPFGPSADQLVAPFDMSVAAGASDFAAQQPSFNSLPPLPTGTASTLFDELIAKPDDTNETSPFWAGKGDIVVNYLVPALAVLALVVAGLLLRELVRRRQRAALARRIKRNFGRSAGRRPAPRSPPRSD